MQLKKSFIPKKHWFHLAQFALRCSGIICIHFIPGVVCRRTTNPLHFIQAVCLSQVSAVVTACTHRSGKAKYVHDTTGKVPELQGHHGRAALRPSKGGPGGPLTNHPPILKIFHNYKGGDIGEGELYTNTFSKIGGGRSGGHATYGVLLSPYHLICII